MLTEKEEIIYEFIKENQHKYLYGFFAEQIPEILGWDMSVRYPDKKYRLASYSIMSRLVKKIWFIEFTILTQKNI